MAVYINWLGATVSKYQITNVPSANLPLVWDRIYNHLERVVDSAHGDITMISLREELLQGQAGLLVIHSGEEIVAAVCVEVRTMPSGKRILMVPIVGGEDMVNWIDQLNAEVKRLKKTLLCDAIRGAGRPGWVRELKKYGWKNVITVVSLEED